VSLPKQGRKTCALWGIGWCHRISGNRGEFEFRPHKVTIKSNKIFGERKGRRNVANDTKRFKSFCDGVVSLTVETELTSLKETRDFFFIFLTVHLRIILVGDQFVAQFLL
jgi:hypothetical protein